MMVLFIAILSLLPFFGLISDVTSMEDIKHRFKAIKEFDRFEFSKPSVQSIEEVELSLGDIVIHLWSHGGVSIHDRKGLKCLSSHYAGGPIGLYSHFKLKRLIISGAKERGLL